MPRLSTVTDRFELSICSKFLDMPIHPLQVLLDPFNGIENFDCELYIPDVEKLQMDGDAILLPKHVIKKLDEIYNMKKLEEAKMKQDAKKEQ